MSEQLKESLSAVMDGEADEFEIRRVLNEAAGDPELRGVWERYHLVRSVMRGEGGTKGADRLSTRFWTQIDSGDETRAVGNSEPIDTGARAPRSNWMTWGQRVAGLAVAAGVAAAVVIGYRTDEAAKAPAAQVAVVEQAVPSDSIALFDDEMRRQSVPAALDLQRAHAYMLHHAHHVALNNRSVVPFVKVAAFESTK
ncbi:MAG TPA: sigma-E factor negative regulatory protein [Pseudomonadales bacterium]|jgi:sigma-E factor negative regulatory protein RseA|nr:sigma-E factor negative regulatory protein [Pseudomonadales bacterium]